jgi:hypothetical protein
MRRQIARAALTTGLALLALAAPSPSANALVDGPTWTARQLNDPSYGFNGALSTAFDGTHLWTANQGGASVTETNASDGSLVRVISGPQYGFSHPWGVAFDGSHVWITNSTGSSVTEISAADGSLVRVLSGGDYAFSGPRGIDFDPATARLWVANEQGGSVTELRVTDGSFVHLFTGPASGLSAPNALLVVGADVWVTNGLTNVVTELNAADGSLVRTIPGIAYPAGLAFDGFHVWVSSWSMAAPAVTEINADSGTIARTVPLSAPRPVGVVAFDGNVFVTLWEAAQVVEIDELDGSIEHTFSTADGGFSFPNGIVSDGNHLWIVNAGNASLTELLDAGPQRPTVLDETDRGPSGTYAEGVTASISTNGSPTTYHAEWGMGAGIYDHAGPELPVGGPLRAAAPVTVAMDLTGLPLLVTVHWRVVAHNANGTRYGADQTTEWIRTFPHGTGYCVKHLQWQLVTADIVGPGCWVAHQPRPWLDAERRAPLPAPYAPQNECFAVTCPPPLPPPPTPPLYLPTNELFRVPDPSKPLMAAIPETAGQKVTVEINGMLVTSDYVVADQPQGYLKANDASIDVAPPADGSLPPTPIARHATLTTRIPVSYVDPATGAPLPLRRHVGWDGPVTPPSCDDAAVRNAPLLGSFSDPAGIGSTLGDLGLGGGPAVVHLVNGQVVVCVDITLPTEPCDGPSAGFTVKATLLADQSGLAVRDLNAHLSCAIIAGIVFQDVDFRFDGAAKRWSAAGTVEAIPGLPLRGGVEFAHGDFAHAFAAATPVALNLGVLRLSEVGFDVYPDRTTGHVVFGSVYHVPYISADPLAIDAGYAFNWAAAPPYVEATGKVAVFGAPTADGDVKVFADGTVTGRAHFHASVAGVFSADADVQADFWHAAPLRFDVDGNASVSVFDLVSESGEVVASDNGAGVCVDTFWGHVGLVVHANGSVDAWPFGDCDISSARDVRPGGSSKAAAVSTIAFPVDAGSSRLLVGIASDGGPPAVTLTGPGGTRIEVPATGVVNTASALEFHDARHGITFVGLRRPAAGQWRVVAAPGSPLLKEVRTGIPRPPVTVHAHVVRSGAHERLVYSGPRVAGQTVTFVERGSAGVAVIARVSGGGSGSLGFTPLHGNARLRTIVAVVSQNGRPRAVRRVGTFRTPPAVRPGRPGRLSLTRRAGALDIAWQPVAGASHYLVLVRASDGSTPVRSTTHAVLRVPRFAAAASARVEVIAVAGSLRGSAARAAIAARNVGLHAVTVAHASLPASARSIGVGFRLDAPARIDLTLLDASLAVVAHAWRSERAGRASLALPLPTGGHRLTAGGYTLVVSATVAGLPPQRSGLAVQLR